ncbi:MAG: hypothetical protein D8M59_09425 [Planctomycetes bacterium]|nr:hypothetical protein [Planctomycetota bacterium]NOG54284.1 hypothetical protein [Planctomycetota bacterium]
MEFMDAVRARRTVREFADRPIPEDVLAEVLEAGRLAAAGRYAQRWYFGVVQDQSHKEALVAEACHQEWIATAPVILALCARLNDDLRGRAADDMVLRVNQERFGEDVIEHLNAFANRQAITTVLQNGDVFIPGQQMFLAAANRGLSACWIGWVNIREAGRVLCLPDDVVCLFLMPMGYPAVEPDPGEWRDIEQMTFHERWGE